MAKATRTGDSFDLVLVGQSGRVQYEALLLVASLRDQDPAFAGQVYVAEPQPGPLWSGDPRMTGEIRAELEAMGCTILPLHNRAFGQSYPHGNKIEALAALPATGPFLFLDSDTLITGPLSTLAAADFTRPTASMRRSGTWPEEELYWPGYTATWKALYDRFELEFDSSLDLSKPDEYWERYLYFNAGWVAGTDAPAFGARWRDWAVAIRDDRPRELVLQSLDPWLDQVALPLVIHSFGGGRPGPDWAGLDGDLTCHWRVLGLAYAREADRVVEVLEAVAAPNRIKKLLKNHEAFKRMIYQGRGRKARALFDRADLPPRERQIRNRLKKDGFWLR
ncbi:MAG: hypothetical protein HLUCCA08_07495 [Rhodobacteraceae bacterium HLUCCA08]|nr:MAG: hypothetical protein HLUCCA08_07495 [Rhodobacteraceae bacterium HLUCCA08]